MVSCPQLKIVINKINTLEIKALFVIYLSSFPTRYIQSNRCCQKRKSSAVIQGLVISSSSFRYPTLKIKQVSQLMSVCHLSNMRAAMAQTSNLVRAVTVRSHKVISQNKVQTNSHISSMRGSRERGTTPWKITPSSTHQRNVIFRRWSDGDPLRILVRTPLPSVKKSKIFGPPPPPPPDKAFWTRACNSSTSR